MLLPRRLRGRNSHGECGLSEWHPVVLAPRPVHGLQDVEVAALAAGKAHSAAVLAGGCAYTWGEVGEGWGAGATVGSWLVAGALAWPESAVQTPLLPLPPFPSP